MLFYLDNILSYTTNLTSQKFVQYRRNFNKYDFLFYFFLEYKILIIMVINNNY